MVRKQYRNRRTGWGVEGEEGHNLKMDLKGGGGSSRNPEAMKDTPSIPHPWAATTLGLCFIVFVEFARKL